MPGFGFTPFGRRPFSTIVDLPLPAVVATNAIAAGMVFTVQIYPVSGSPIYVATDEFATRDTDSLPNQPFAGTLEKPLRFHRSIVDGTRLGGMSSGYGEIVINNPGGEYDAYANSLDGARVIVRMGARGASFDSFARLYDGLIDGAATADEDALTLHLYDDNKRLEIPAAPNVYGGTGGMDGDENCKGKRKPLMLGVGTCPPLLIDAANLVYQYHDGASPAGEFYHVYDRGVELAANSTPDYASYAALVAATITPGRYATCLAQGILRLGAKPDGIVTATMIGTASNGLVANYPTVGAPIQDTFNLVHWLITNSGVNIVVDTGSVTAAATAQPAQVGYFVDPNQSETLRQVIDNLTYGVLGWAGFRRDRTFEVGVIAVPAGSPLGDYTEKDYFTIRQLPLPSMMSPPPYRIRAAWGRNFAVQGDIDAAIDVNIATRFKDPYSVAASSNAGLSATILAAHPQAQDPDVWPSYFVLESTAVAFCNAVLTLFGDDTRALFEITLPADAYALNIGNAAQLTDDRYGLSGGDMGAIVSIDDDTAEEQATVQVLC